MKANRPLSIVRSAAQKLTESLRIRRPEEIDIELIAAHCGAYVTYRSLGHEEGHLLRTGKTGLMVVDLRARHSEKWRFVIAHELGHFLQHADVDQFKLCTSTDLNDWYRTSGHEVEANEFAAELLMPQTLFERMCDRDRPSLKDVRELAATFQTSLTATAIRFITFAPEPCALVHSTGGVIDWWAKTDNFAFTLSKARRLTTNTYAGDIFAGKAVDDRPQLLDGSSWSDDSRAEGREVYEHSIKLGSYNAVLTLLWHRCD
ncbi:MAG: ImmA/IrrE family metallo-endopeptidase [Deltaproteobacteria bacterium]|nr:ImmA/IrrE family metallo-endopeptidase [Deltaproteobacteria bacterium]